eukprot:TRINITY_DN782_c0_g1_i1.p1 TRINITY_DN782_c0_g1~~TRINITY_DN782_c0_g1_i1.p1  ORF type:complete len:348 (-),score=106.29 TRINITY_DN782_c0_g1_i1:817-1860(-)
MANSPLQSVLNGCRSFLLRAYLSFYSLVISPLTNALGLTSVDNFLSLRKYLEKNVKGERVLITGGSSGLGKLMAQRFLELGSTVVLWDVNEKMLKDAKDSFESKFGQGKVFAYVIDVTKKENVYSTAAKVKKEVGKIDILINNAGVVGGNYIWDAKDESIERVMNVNALAPIFVTKAFVTEMMNENHGHLVFISSMVIVSPSFWLCFTHSLPLLFKASTSGIVRLSDYCASKWAIFGFAESVRLDLNYVGKDGVKTTIVCPFYINTGMFEGVQGSIAIGAKVLDQNYVVDRILNAVLTDKEELFLPGHLNLITYLGRLLLPAAARDFLLKAFGISSSMDHFKSTRRV